MILQMFVQHTNSLAEITDASEYQTNPPDLMITGLVHYSDPVCSIITVTVTTALYEYVKFPGLNQAKHFCHIYSSDRTSTLAQINF